MSNSGITTPDEVGETRAVQWVIALQFALAAAVAVVGLGADRLFGVSPGSEDLIYPACAMLSAICCWTVWSWYLSTRRLFDPYVLFILAAIAFNAGQALLEVAGANDGRLLAQFSAATVVETVFLVALGLSWFHLGGLASLGGSGRKRPRAREYQTHGARMVGYVLLAVSVVPALRSLTSATVTVLTSGYSGLYQREASTGIDGAQDVLAAFLVPGALFMLAGSRGRRFDKVLSAVMIVGYSSTRLFLGSRSTAAMALIAFGWLWHRSVRPFPRSVLVACGTAMVFVVFPLVGAVRDTSGSERLSFASVSQAYLSMQNPAIASVSEMGNSMSVVAYTLDMVPATRPFDLGAGYAYAVLTIVPNLFWAVHPSIARGLAGDWLIWKVSPDTARSGGGLGFSFIAEAYLNFGWLGAPLALAVLGFLFGRLTIWAATPGVPARMALVASFLAFFLFFARGESASQVRPLLWYAVLPYWLSSRLGSGPGVSPQPPQGPVASGPQRKRPDRRLPRSHPVAT